MSVNRICFFNTSCPSGWTRVSAADNYLLMGGATYGVTGGSATHTHTVTFNSTTVANATAVNLRTGSTAAVSRYNHGHTVASTGSLTTSTGSNLPAYRDIVLCSHSEVI